MFPGIPVKIIILQSYYLYLETKFYLTYLSRVTLCTEAWDYFMGWLSQTRLQSRLTKPGYLCIELTEYER